MAKRKNAESVEEMREARLERFTPPNSPDSAKAEPPSPPKLERQDAMMNTDVRMCETCPATLAPQDPEFARQCYDCYRDDRTKRPCRVCAKPKIPVTEPEWKDVCGACYKNAAMRPCTQCKQYTIRSTDPAWRVICQDCFKSKNWKRTCDDCGNRPIRDDLPAYVTKCSSCYLTAKKKTHDECMLCVTGDQRGQWKRIESPMCRNCMVGQNLIKTIDTLVA
jgi:hypothetical protein